MHELATDEDLQELARLVWRTLLGKVTYDNPQLVNEPSFRPYTRGRALDDGLLTYVALRGLLDRQDWREVPSELVALCSAHLVIRPK